MRAGRLDRTIIIEGDAEEIGRDPFNDPIYGEPLRVIMRASVEQKSGREFFAAQTTQASRQVVFRIRFIEGITVLNRVVYESITHNIVEVREIGRREGIELHTEAGV